MAQPFVPTTDLSAAVTHFNMGFQNVWDNTPTFMDKCGSQIPVNTSRVITPWSQIYPQMRRWLGERKINALVANGITYTPLKYELTVGISREDVEDDLIGLTLAAAPGHFAREIKRQPEILVSQLLENNPNTFDNVSFFSSAHPIDFSLANSPTTNSNVLLTSALTADNVNKLQAQMLLLQAPDLSPTNYFPTILMVHPNNALIARQLANGSFYPTNNGPGTGGTAAVGPISNEMRGFVDVVVNPFLTQPERWYLICNTSGYSPLVWFERTAPEIQYRVSSNDSNVFDQDNFLIGARRRGCAGLGLYYMMGVGTTAASLTSIALPAAIQ